jgi:membrane-associated protein
MLYNVLGAFAWIGLLASIGYYLGTYQWVRENVEYIVIGLIIITLFPIISAFKRKK